MRPRIFVPIASYRDAELPWTIRDLRKKAAYPERVKVGVCWQFISPDDDHHFRFPFPPDEVRVRAYDARSSKGACWARAIAHGLREDEEYVLQVDSHMRFHQGWDEALLAELAACPSRRAALSTYPAPYQPPDDMMTCGTFELAPRAFDAAGILTFQGRPINSTRPVPTAFVAGGFIFAPAQMFVEVPYDPRVYFIGEEVSYAARAWTSGWDIYAPSRCVVHHYYGRGRDPKHWGDHSGWHDTNSVSLRRVRHVLRLASESNAAITDATDGPLGLGVARSLADYQRFAGVDLARRVIL